MTTALEAKEVSPSHQGLLRYRGGPEAIDTLPERMIALAHLFAERCERLVGAEGRSFAEKLEECWPGRGRRVWGSGSKAWTRGLSLKAPPRFAQSTRLAGCRARLVTGRTNSVSPRLQHWRAVRYSLSSREAPLPEGTVRHRSPRQHPAARGGRTQTIAAAQASGVPLRCFRPGGHNED